MREQPARSVRKIRAEKATPDGIVRTYVVTAKLRLRAFESPGRRKFPKCDQCDQCGQGHYWNVVWPSALVMSEYLAKRTADIGLRGKSALVIGCGAGLESIVAAKMGAAVRILDHSLEALKLTRENCRFNGIENIKTTKCCWLDAEKVGRLLRHDILIGSDVLYNIGKKETLHRLLGSALKKDGIALFAEPERVGAEDPRRMLDGSSFRIESSFSRIAKDGVEVWVYRVRRVE